MSSLFSPSTSAIFRFVGWSFLPNALSNGAIIVFHRVLRPNSPPPKRGTPAYITQYRIAFTILGAAYLIYTLAAAATTLEPNYYQILGVDHGVDEQGLKMAFRQFARRNHPDRPEIGAAGAERFRAVRDAYDMLKNPAKRFAYERFGPDIVAWKECTTPSEYVRRGIKASVAFPLGTALVLGGMSILGQSSASSFWRYVILGFVLFAEAYLVLSPTTPPSSAEGYTHSLPFLSWLLPYQQVSFLHQTFVSLSVCFAQLGPVLFPNAPKDDKFMLKAVSEAIQRIAGISGAAQHEVNRMIQSELLTLRGARPTLPSPMPSYTQITASDDTTINALTAEMESLLIDARLRAHPVIGAMWDRVADEAREKLASSTSPILAGCALEMVDRGTFTSPFPSPTKASYGSGSVLRAFHPQSPSQEPSPISPTFTSVSTHLRYPEQQDSGQTSDMERSETGSAATLLDGGRGSRSRSASPFTYIGPVHSREGTAGRESRSGDALQVPLLEDVIEAGFERPKTPIRSLGKSAGSKMKQKSATSLNGSANTGARFFPSDFSTSAS